MGPARRALRETAIAAFFLALAAIATRPLALDLRGRTLAGPDPVIDLWTVNWLSGHVFQPTQLFGGNVYHPEPHAVLYSDLSLGTAVLLVPLRLLVDDPVPLYNLGLLLALALAGWAFHLLARGLTGSVSAGLLAGTLAAFGSHQLSHVYHLNLLTTGWLALFLLGLEQLLTRPSPGAVVLTGASFALTAQSSGYYAVAAALLALVFAAARWRALRSRRVLAASGLAALLGGLLVLPYASSFLELRAVQGLRRPPGMSARMAFVPGRDLGSRSYLYGPLLGREGEKLFPGVLTLALAAVALARRRPHAVLFGAFTLVLLLVSLGPEALPYRALFAIPPLDSMRHPYTFAAVATFTLSVLAGLGWAGFRAASRPWAGAGVVALAVLETLGPGPDLRDVPAGVPPAYEALESLPPGPVLEVPVFAPDALLWAARHGRPVLNGDGAFVPARHGVLERQIQNHWIKRTPVDVDDTKPAWMLAEELPVRYVIVPAGRRPALRALAEAFDRSETFGRVATARDGDRIYEVRR